MMTRLRDSTSGKDGFTLIELLITLVLVSIIGMALVRLSVSQSHFTLHQDAQRHARSVANGALNVLLSELRMVETEGGVVAAGSDSIRIRVPISFGIICGSASGVTTLSLLPTDSATLSNAAPSGYAYRVASDYLYRDTINATAGTAAVCDADSITTVTGGRMMDVTPEATAGAGTPVFVYQTIQYDFKESTILPLRQSLWRTAVSTGATEEIAMPFDTASAFSFYVLNADTSQAAPPASLGDIRGLEFNLVGESEIPAQGETEPTEFHLTATVHFQNRAN